ncbi:hypothetical protein DYU11_11590 [Fibrisoma montanum]|uniref:Uncharacterized protein n=1 Tax=Fibrisoma montanum TaxID=2305895 RepID=A0A418MB64_9BACT|nr:hypothetical protein [Fibrisoma montanum]RIV23617.1 hypothetical protein DYU11_11590 [Fibrisoma montanum]
MRGTVVKIPLYFERLRILVSEVLEKPEYDAYVMFQKDEMVLHIKPDASIGIIAHETVHIVNHVFKQCGILLDVDNDEPQAYLTGWVANQIYKAIHERKQRQEAHR